MISFTFSAQAESSETLVIYGLDYEPQQKENIKSLEDILIYMGENAKFIPFTDTKSIHEYERVILLIGEDSVLQEELKNEVLSGVIPVMIIGSGGLAQLFPDSKDYHGSIAIRYDFSGSDEVQWLANASHIRYVEKYDYDSGGSIQTSEAVIPLCAVIGNFTIFSWYDGSIIPFRLSLANELSKWLNPGNVSYLQSSAKYVVLDNVYPFDDYDHLIELVDMMNEEGIPYAISVMPVYFNTEYPSMKRFCEILRYAQSKGAAIVLHSPLVSISAVEPDKMVSKIEQAYRAYAGYGVYPLAIETPKQYLYSDVGHAVLKPFSTVLLLESQDTDLNFGIMGTTFQDFHQIIAPDYSENGQPILFGNTFPAAIYFDVHMEVAKIRNNIQRIKNASIPIHSLWGLTNKVEGEGISFENNYKGSVLYNNERVSLSYIPYDDEGKFDYQRGFIQYFANEIETGNQIIILLVLFASGIFVIFIILARRQVHRQLLSRGDKEFDPYADVDEE